MHSTHMRPYSDHLFSFMYRSTIRPIHLLHSPACTQRVTSSAIIPFGFSHITNIFFGTPFMAGTDIATEAVKGIASTITAAVVRQIKNIVELEENLERLNTDFKRVEAHLRDIDEHFQAQQRSLPPTVDQWLTNMTDALEEAKQLVESAQQQRRRCYGCCLPCNPNLTTRVRNWDAKFRLLFQDLHLDVSITANVHNIASTSAPHANVHNIASTSAPHAKVLRQDVPDHIVGKAIESASEKLHTWLTEPAHSHAHVTGIYGMGGVGKTTVLKVVHNNCKEKVSGCIFDYVIWYTVSKYKSEEEDNKIKELQFSIAHTLQLDLNDCPNPDIRKMTLSKSLENRRFLLILDDLWSQIDLEKVGINFGRAKGSKVLISSRSSDVIKTMGASDHYSLKMELLSAEQGWELFRSKAFANGAVPENNIETTAREIARECKGLPLALNVVSAALRSETNPRKWRKALEFMRNVDPTFPDTHSTIDRELYRHLRLSYNDLPNHLKSCFLYCAAFPEDAEIEVETLMEMWSAEGFLIRKGMTQLLDAGREYIDALVSRCLIEYVGVRRMRIPAGERRWAIVEREVIKVHDVLRDMAIYIGERDEDWVFASGQHLQQFPGGEATRNCKRLSVSHNDIEELPTDLECTELRCLVLAHNMKLTKVPAASFFNIMSLKVLDLSCTLITSLPTSVGQLGQLEFLNFTGCYLLKELPESICSLSRLQFLNLDCCVALISLPDKIGDLEALKHFSFDVIGGGRSIVIPRGIFGLTSLTKLCLPMRRPGCAISMEDLQNLSNLRELSIALKAHTMSNCECRWLKNMRKLKLRYAYDANAARRSDNAPGDAVDEGDADRDVVKDAVEEDGHDDDAVEVEVEDAAMEDILQNMNELQSLRLIEYRGRSLPSYVRKLPNLEELWLSSCAELRELPVLEIGGETASASFPMLKSLKIWNCPLVMRLPTGIERLCNLKEIKGSTGWWSALIWEDEAARLKLQPLFEDRRSP